MTLVSARHRGDALIATPPRVFVIQTRGPLILRDVARLRALSSVTSLRVSFSLTTDCDDVRRRYEPRCAPILERLQTMRALREAGIDLEPRPRRGCPRPGMRAIRGSMPI